MSPGVNFTRKAAERISNVVKEVENRPFPTNQTQRRRGGGLGRSTLWEVTEVFPAADPPTCTIKRVSNIDFDLNDPSEKTDILYDPNIPVSEGDTGILIRLGEGDLFFFSRRGRFIEYIPFINLVNAGLPDTSYPPVGAAIIGDPNTYSGGRTGNMDQIGVCKFQSPLIYDQPLEYPNGRKLKDINMLFGWSALGNQNAQIVLPQLVTSRVYMQAYYIHEDYDENDLTYNDYMALDVTTAQTVQLFVAVNRAAGDSDFGAAAYPSVVFASTDSTAAATFLTGLFTGEKPVYGFGIEFVYTGTDFYWYWQIRQELTENNAPATYLEWSL